jgi:enoyl-CoA hydratase/carnithine racemase
MTTWITTEDRGPVRWFTLSNPGRKNAVPLEGWGALREAMREFEDSQARVGVIRGADGDFCAGADLDPGRLEDSGVVAGHRRMKEVAAAATALHRVGKPLVAAVDGVAVGAGMNLALGCDVIIASTRARFSEIFVRRGLTPDFGGSWLLPRVVGMQRAKELALSGRIVEAGEAERIGLCLEVVEPARLEERAAEMADSFLQGAPLAQMFAKQGLDASWELSFEEALGWEGQSQSILFSSSDFLEGVAAFLQKRPPDFGGK